MADSFGHLPGPARRVLRRGKLARQEDVGTVQTRSEDPEDRFA